MDAEGKTQSRTERESGLPQGYMSRLLGTSVKAKQIFSPGPEIIGKLADYLKVSYEWLARGRGAMRLAGWAPTPLEEATLFAQRHGTRQDAIDAAIRRFGAEALTALEWIFAFDAEARRLERAGVPRPELAVAEQRKFRRLARRRAELEREIAALQDRPSKSVPLLPPAPTSRRGKR